MIEKKQIENLLETNIFGKYLYIFDDIDSTNMYARKLAREGAPEGTVVLADFQSAGRGRMDHVWQSERGKNLLLSLVLRPQMEIETVQRLTLATADLMISMLTDFLTAKKIEAPSFSVKWPNDILVGEKKIAGILTESAVQSKKIEYAVVGIGLNVNQTRDEFPADIRDVSTSLYTESRKIINIAELTAALLNHFEKAYIHLECTNYESVINDWKEHCLQIGHTVLLETPNGEESGLFWDVHDNGRLVYRTASGEDKELIAGSIKKVIR